MIHTQESDGPHCFWMSDWVQVSTLTTCCLQLVRFQGPLHVTKTKQESVLDMQQYLVLMEKQHILFESETCHGSIWCGANMNTFYVHKDTLDLMLAQKVSQSSLLLSQLGIILSIQNTIAYYFKSKDISCFYTADIECQHCHSIEENWTWHTQARTKAGYMRTRMCILWKHSSPFLYRGQKTLAYKGLGKEEETFKLSRVKLLD